MKHHTIVNTTSRSDDPRATTLLKVVYYWYSAGYTACLKSEHVARELHVVSNKGKGQSRHAIGHPNIIGPPTDFLCQLYNAWDDMSGNELVERL